MRVIVVLIAVVGVWGIVPDCQAQYWGGPSYHASTAMESAARGTADVIRSSGAANLMNSEAAKNYEQARSQYIDNRLKYTKTYFEMKEVNNYYREANRKPRPTSEQLFRLAKDKTPGRLAPTELDPVTGAISWPAVVEADEFVREREAVEALFAQASETEGKMSVELNGQLRQAIGDLQDSLNAKINDYPPQAWSQASAFLKKLDYEVRLKA